MTMARRREKFDRSAREHFLAVLGQTASPTRAAAAVGVSRTWAYAARERDFEFKIAWDEAVDLAMERLLEESYRRAVDGVEEPVVQGGRVVSVRDPETGEERPFSVIRYSDRLMEVLLKFRYPDQMADRLRADVRVDGLGLAPEALLRMTPSERRTLIALLTKYRTRAVGRLSVDGALAALVLVEEVLAAFVETAPQAVARMGGVEAG
jgi:hypothetical protein